MQVKIGWSREVLDNQWSKIDIILEEEDYRSVLADAELDIPEGVFVKTGLKFLLMKLEAERLVATHIYESGHMSEGEFKAEVEELLGKKDQILAILRQKYLNA